MSEGSFWQRKLLAVVGQPVKKKRAANRKGRRLVVSVRLDDASIDHLNLIKLITNKANAQIFKAALEPALLKECEELKAGYNDASWKAFVQLVHADST